MRPLATGRSAKFAKNFCAGSLYCFMLFSLNSAILAKALRTLGASSVYLPCIFPGVIITKAGYVAIKTYRLPVIA